MPVFNRAATLRRAVDSVLAQDFADFELIVVDDASTDASAAVVENVADPRIQLIRLDRNSGSNAARNRGIMAAAAPLLCFLDSDDAYLPHKLGTVVRMFTDRPELEVLVDSFSKLYPSGDPHNQRRRTNPTINSSDEFAEALFARRLWKATSAISVKRYTAIRVGLFDETLKRRQDFEFLIRLARGAQCASTDRVLWVKTWTPGAISDDSSSFMSSTLELYRRHPAYLTDRAYRPGLARDVTRHVGRSIGKGNIRMAASDVATLAREFGTVRTGQLLFEGGMELLRRARRRHA